MATHKIPESVRFKGPAKYVEYLFARVLITVLQRVPIRFACRIGRGVGWLAWNCMGRRRATVRKNLEIINRWAAQQADGQQSFVGLDMSIDQQVKEVFQRSGANLLSGFTFARMRPETAEKHIVFEGLELLKSSLADNKGVIILLAHMGPWEALAQLPQVARKIDIQAPFGALYRPLNNNYLDEWFKGVRETQGTRLFSHRDGFHKPVDFLRSGGVLGILADQKMRQGESVEFFGKVCKTNPLPGLFQRRCGVDVVGLSISTIGHCKWKLKFQSVNFTAVSEKRNRSSEAQISNHCLEQMLTTSPLDVFWFHKRF
jgi:KDO2-lipid IV(A) lauroyltransferase